MLFTYQLLPPGGHFGKNPVFKKSKKVFRNRFGFYTPEEGQMFVRLGVKQQKM